MEGATRTHQYKRFSFRALLFSCGEKEDVPTRKVGDNVLVGAWCKQGRACGDGMKMRGWNEEFRVLGSNLPSET